MLDWLAILHRQEMEKYYVDRVRIERWNAELGSWGVVADDVPSQVQLPRSSDSSDDPDVATTEEMTAIRVYMRWDTDVRPGDRILWRGDPWVVNGVTGHRSADVNRIAQCSRSQSALLPEPIRFRRRYNGEWIELGQFMMRFTTRSAGPTLPVGEQTAEGQVTRAAMIGGPESAILKVGDWFGRDGLPGRILEKDDHEPAHIEFLYEMETVVP